MIYEGSLLYVLKNKRYIQIIDSNQMISPSTHINLRGANYFAGNA